MRRQSTPSNNVGTSLSEPKMFPSVSVTWFEVGEENGKLAAQV